MSAAALVACAGSDVPVRGDGVGTGGSQSASNGGSANAGTAGNDGEGGSAMPGGGEGGSGMPSGGTGGDNSSTGGTGGGSDDCDGAALIVSHCGSSGCHDGSIGAFAKDAAAVGEALGQPSALYASCGSGVLIDPDDSTQGVIYDKINGAACGGSPMPLGPALSAADKTCIEDFLDGLTQ